MAWRFLVFLGGCITEAAKSSPGLLSRAKVVINPAQDAWQQQFETKLDTSLTQNLQALDQLLKHSTTLGQHFIEFQNTALAISRRAKNVEHMQASSRNSIHSEQFTNAVGGVQQTLGRLQADMQGTFAKMEQQYKMVTDRTKETKALMDKVMSEKVAADSKHQEVERRHGEMLKNIQAEHSEFDKQMQTPPPEGVTTTAAPEGVTTTAAPPTTTPAGDLNQVYDKMVNGLEQQQDELQSQMKELDAMLGSTNSLFQAAVNATATLKAKSAQPLVPIM